MDSVLAVAVVVAGALGTTVALVRTPGRQALVQAVYGLALAVVFVLLEAPDVALSQLGIGVVIVPLMTLATLARIERVRR